MARLLLGEVELVASEEGSLQYTEKGLRILWGLHSQVDLDHVPKVFREPVRGFSNLLRQKPPFLFNLSDLPISVVHLSGFCGKDGGIVELNAVFLVDTVFTYGRLVWLFQSSLTDVHGMACLP
jgi:hypothetical protein